MLPNMLLNPISEALKVLGRFATVLATIVLLYPSENMPDDKLIIFFSKVRTVYCKAPPVGPLDILVSIKGNHLGLCLGLTVIRRGFVV